MNTPLTTVRKFPPVTLERLDLALAIIAEAIETHSGGEVYWPLFERLERERKALVSRADRLAAARARVGAETQNRTMMSHLP
ncbi:MAG: hypothetical protein MnENMB40S_13520 [Rhizobiaceae bacterium MnEN-MB40S]|nr:MAG: hypothetical protein MnENMB40S_13520 [Rhizobiaceae bacterium MnEN-MB40S]